MLVYTSYKSCNSCWTGLPKPVKGPEQGGRRSPPPSNFTTPTSCFPEAGSLGPGWACGSARILCWPLLGEMAHGRSRSVGRGLGGKGRGAHISQLPGSINPIAHEKDGPPQMFISVLFAAQRKAKPTGEGTHPRSPSGLRPGGQVPHAPPGRKAGWRRPEPAPQGAGVGEGGELALPGNRAAARTWRGGAAVCRASGRDPLAASPSAEQLPHSRR